MAISSLCVINENCDFTKVCEFEKKVPDSIADYSSFAIDKDTTIKCNPKKYWDSTIKYFKSKNIFICVGIVWTLTFIVLTICMLMFLEVL